MRLRKWSIFILDGNVVIAVYHQLWFKYKSKYTHRSLFYVLFVNISIPFAALTIYSSSLAKLYSDWAHNRELKKMLLKKKIICFVSLLIDWKLSAL